MKKKNPKLAELNRSRRFYYDVMFTRRNVSAAEIGTNRDADNRVYTHRVEAVHSKAAEGIVRRLEAESIFGKSRKITILKVSKTS